MPRKDFVYLSERHKRRLLHNQLIAYQQTPNIDGPDPAKCQVASDRVPVNNNVDGELFEKLPYDTQIDISDNVNETDVPVNNTGKNDNFDAYVNDRNHTDSEIMDESEIEIESHDDDSLSDQSLDDEQAELDLSGDLRALIVTNNLSQKVTNDLLMLLNRHFPSAYLPKDARTLMHTPISTNSIIETINGGKFVYFGLKDGIVRSLRNNFSVLPVEVKIDLNVDGLPLVRSTGSQFWPIMSLIVADFYIDPFVIAVHHGIKKPHCPNQFLEPFVNEALSLIESGISIGGKVIKLTINAIICDVPARSYVTGTKGHTGYFGCGKCTQEGDYVNHRVTFPETNCIARTDDSFRLRQQPEHHIQFSVLERLDIGMVTQVPNDILHLGYLGVGRKLIFFYVKGKKGVRFESDVAEIVSQKLIATRPCIPSEFCRKPRSLSDIEKWKGTEVRQFVLYTGPVILKGFLTANKYKHFLSFSVALRIMSSIDASAELLEYAHSLLVWFVDNYATLYGKEHITFNVHNLIHLLDDVKTFGPLDNFSSFPFENHMQKIKKKIKVAGRPLEQLINRMAEEEHGPVSPPLTKKFPLIHYSKFNATLVKEIEFKSFSITSSNPNNVCLLKDGSYASVNGFTMKDGLIYCEATRYTEVTLFFDSPCDSTLVGIVRAFSDKKSPVINIEASLIKAKCMALESNEGRSVLLPMIQSHKH